MAAPNTSNRSRKALRPGIAHWAILGGAALIALFAIGLPPVNTERISHACQPTPIPPYIRKDGGNVDGMTFYTAYDPTNGTVGQYRARLNIDATGAVDNDLRFFVQGPQWVYEELMDDLTQGWTNDNNPVTARGAYSPSFTWDDAAVIPPGEGGNRKDGPLSKSVTILAVQGLITGPSHQWVNSAPYRLDHQGVTTTSARNPCPVSFQGSLLPQHNRLRPFWEITGGGGTFQSPTDYSLSPTHVLPSSAAQGATAIMHVQFKNESNEWEDTGISDDQVFDIFDSHLSRDLANDADPEGDQLNSHNVETNCKGAANHAYKGTVEQTGIEFPPWKSSDDHTEEQVLYKAPQDVNLPVENPWTAEDTAKLQRGDCLTILGWIGHIVTVTGDGTTLWEYNGKSGTNFGKKTVEDYTGWLTDDGQFRRVTEIIHWSME
ncbi:MAG: hypothetical protein NTW86_25080 [Candidatus Sumerlaeota bacterium]|nr:hypothetical protein [Candidatus Sumerlaeota bacterium]